MRQFSGTTRIEELSNYRIKIVNVNIVYDLDSWPGDPLNNFTLRNCLFGPTNIEKY